MGTSRANPGKSIKSPADLAQPEKTALIRNIYHALVDLQIDGLISIGGDDTLKTANFLHEFQRRLPARRQAGPGRPSPEDHRQRLRGHRLHVRLLHRRRRHGEGAQEPARRRRRHGSYFIVETMGRKAGWLSYGVGIAGEANLVFSVEDIEEEMLFEEEIDRPRDRQGPPREAPASRDAGRPHRRA